LRGGKGIKKLWRKTKVNKYARRIYSKRIGIEGEYDGNFEPH